MNDKARKDIKKLATEISTESYFAGIANYGAFSFFTSPIMKLFRKSTPEKVSLFVAEHGAEALNIPIDASGKTIYDVAMNPTVMHEIVPEGQYKNLSRRVSGEQAVIELLKAHGAKPSGMMSNSPPRTAEFKKAQKRLAYAIQQNAILSSKSNILTNTVQFAEDKTAGTLEQKIEAFTAKYGDDALNEPIAGYQYTLLDVAEAPSVLASFNRARKQMHGMKAEERVISLLQKKGAKPSATLQQSVTASEGAQIAAAATHNLEDGASHTAYETAKRGQVHSSEFSL